MEEWKQCGESVKMIYYVSNQGCIKSVTKKKKKEKILKLWIANNGYKFVTMLRIKYTVHSLVALCFIGERPYGFDIDHINRIRDDNRVENLRYCTRQENLCNTSRFKDNILETNPLLRKKITTKLWRENIMDKEKEKERCRNKYYKNKDKLSQKYTCDCGSELTIHHKARHEKSKKHKLFLNKF